MKASELKVGDVIGGCFTVKEIRKKSVFNPMLSFEFESDRGHISYKSAAPITKLLKLDNWTVRRDGIQIHPKVTP